VEIRDLEYLVASASAGNFGRAAESLGLNTSTISRRIGRLEDELGLALFERGHYGVRLTAGSRAVNTSRQACPRRTGCRQTFGNRERFR
jgi:DNA-binding transcriptional LysR family regulator